MRSSISTLLVWTLCFGTGVFIHCGCSSLNDPLRFASSTADAEAKTFTPIPNRASIYIYRDQSYMGEEVITVDLGSWAGGRTKGKTYLQAVLKPGEYVVIARGDERDELQIEVEEGEVYFIKIRVRPAPVTANASLSLVDAEAGKAGVGKCRLVRLDDEPK